MKRLNLLLQVVLLVVCFAAVALPAQGQWAITQGPNGHQFEAEATNGPDNCWSGPCGTINDVTGPLYFPIVHQFCSSGPFCTDGVAPNAPLLLGVDNNLYGTATWGGNGVCSSGIGCGTIYVMSPVSPYNFTVLYTFCLTSGCLDGAYPNGGLIQGPNYVLYGTTVAGGAHDMGTVFAIQTSGGRMETPLTTLFSFDGTNGSGPKGTLTLGSDGNLHGTTWGGGTYGKGTAFVITLNGDLVSAQSLGAPKTGGNPNGGLAEASKGVFFGTASEGGVHAYGTVFKTSPTGKVTTVLNFDGKNGATPQAGLILATDGNLYGTSSAGGKYGLGTAFKITLTGKLTTLKSFNGTDGANPTASLMQDTNGIFYGTTTMAGSNGIPIFKLSAGLAPFVETLPTSGSEGTSVTILGTNLKGASSVSFNGTAAQFEVISASEISAIVPNGATSGTVQVVTPKGTLDSNEPFQVQ